MNDRAEDAFGDLLGVFLQKEREKEARSKPNRLRAEGKGGSGRGSAIAGKRVVAPSDPRAPGWFVRFMLFFQIAMIYFAPFLVISAPSGSGADVVTDKIETYLFLPVMLLAQMLIFMATMMHAVSSGVFALGCGVSTFLCSYYACVFAYALSMGGSGEAGSRSPFLRRIGFSFETSMSVAVFSLYFGAFSLLVALVLSFCGNQNKPKRPKELHDRPTALPIFEGSGTRRIHGRTKASLGVGPVGEGSA